MRKTLGEQIESALHSQADIIANYYHFAFGPLTDIALLLVGESIRCQRHIGQRASEAGRSGVAPVCYFASARSKKLNRALL
jgi:hypothetical protein